jgi:hypothetical protein
LMLENRFPRIWVPDAENRDLRQLLWHRHRLVQMRTRVMNQLLSLLQWSTWVIVPIVLTFPEGSAAVCDLRHSTPAQIEM